VNITENSLSRAAAVYTENEMEFLKLLASTSTMLCKRSSYDIGE